MKSLEIVDSHIKSIVDYLDNPQVKEDIDCLNIMCVGVSYKELQQIKQDLEILEILRKYMIVVGQYKNNRPNSFITLRAKMDRWGGRRFSNYIDDEKVVDDFNKVKQWLEENE